MGYFSSLCLCLASLYAALGLLAGVQGLRIVRGDWDSAKIALSVDQLCCLPHTTQKALHMLIGALCGARVAFFLVALYHWDVVAGVISSKRLLFYVLDETADVLFFSVCTLVAMFWAELYYIATNSPNVYVNIVRPLIYLLNIAAYVSLFLLWDLDTTSWSSSNTATPLNFAVYVCVTYAIAAACFVWYSKSLTHEFQQVPVELNVRREKIFELRALVMVLTSCLIIKAVSLLLIAGKRLYLNSEISFIAAFWFFFGLELVPVSVVLYYQRHVSRSHTHTHTHTYTHTHIHGDPSFSPLLPKTSISSIEESVDAAIYRLSSYQTLTKPKHIHTPSYTF